MAYYLSYIFNDDGKRNKHSNRFPAGLYHGSIALTEHNPPDAPKIIAKIGFFNNGQIELEDFLKPEPGRKFFHKTYPITQEEMEKLVQRINLDRNIKVKGRKRVPELILARKKRYIKSLPGGPKYSFYRFNCKSYAMSVLKSIGIIDSNLNNWVIDNPGTGDLKPLEFEIQENDVLKWTVPIHVTNRLNQKKLDKLSSEERETIQLSIQFNEMQAVIGDVGKILADVDLSKMHGIKLLKDSFADIQQKMEKEAEIYNECKKILESPPEEFVDFLRENANRLDGFKKYLEDNHLTYKNANQLKGVYAVYVEGNLLKRIKYKNKEWLEKCHDAVRAFEGEHIKNYSIKQYIVDSLKRALNYLGTKFSLSTQHKVGAIITRYKSNLGNAAKLELSNKVKNISKSKK